MKPQILTTLILFCSLTFCSKDEHNYALTRIVSFTTVNQIAINCPGSTLKLDLIYDNMNYDQIDAVIESLTFSKWVEPNDTIWILKKYKNAENQILNIFYVYPDSIFYKSYVKSAIPYYCPEY